MDTAVLEPGAINRLKWRCRRGLLENDLFIERFFSRYEDQLTPLQAQGLLSLMELSDNDLLDLLLRRSEPSDEMNRPEVHDVLAMMRSRNEPPER
ncbi:succinate dehydrogenase assembly factor 2 [Aquincola sp. MAHUQ-54]|uniref:FAD assembly factor SdhE n=1 Tax=Aquincola agrisoli TaxID=3119538 RepID=A0AAW9QC01_9BURK